MPDKISENKVRHPAKFSDEILRIFKSRIYPLDFDGNKKIILDPFAGVGKIKNVFKKAICFEIEFEWAKEAKGIQANSLNMPLRNNCVDVIVTSPVYGNRMSDCFVDHKKEKAYTRYTYTHMLGKDLNVHNAGKLNWGPKYKAFHEKAYKEVNRVLKTGGFFYLNISDHIRGGKVAPVSEWHKETILNLGGFSCIKNYKIKTKRMRHGKNHKARVDFENLFIFHKEG